MRSSAKAVARIVISRLTGALCAISVSLSVVLFGTANGSPSLFSERQHNYIWGDTGDDRWVDWTLGEAIVESIMPPFRDRPRFANEGAAYRSAQKMLDALMARLPVTSKDRVLSFESGDEIEDPVRDAIKKTSANLKIVERRISPDNTVTLTATADLRRFLVKEVLSRVKSTYSPAGYRGPKPGGKSQKNSHVQGLIIDARGTRIVPALAPRILDANGEVLYGLSEANRSCAVEQGIVSYRRTIDPAGQKAVAAGRYRQVRALGVIGETPADLVVSITDKDVLRSLARDSDAFEQCRVIVLTD